MGKGFGIAALVISILGIFVPVITLYVVWIALILTALSGYFGEKGFSIASLIICFVNIAFFSPTTWAVLIGERLGGGIGLMLLTIIFFIAPIVTMIITPFKPPKPT